MDLDFYVYSLMKIVCLQLLLLENCKSASQMMPKMKAAHYVFHVDFEHLKDNVSTTGTEVGNLWLLT